eukprot:8983021-Lingulodinium_polyedra.AAC.1
MPLKSCHFWRLSRTEGLGGSQQGGSWAMPCCGRAWQWGVCAFSRTFLLRQSSSNWLQGLTGGERRRAGEPRLRGGHHFPEGPHA